MRYIDREGGAHEESSSQEKLLKILYGTTAGRLLLKPLVRPGVSKVAGAFLNTRLSRLLIEPFIEANHIPMDDYECVSYPCYNAFFSRRIRDGRRPLAGDERTLVSPCDSFVSAYPISEGQSFEVKNTRYSVTSLLRSGKLAKRYEGGTALILRLTVTDYHRYAYPADGVVSEEYRIPGIFHTVNPIAGEVYPIYKENSREFSLLRTEQFGTVLQMEVGALLVGKIVNDRAPGCVRRGEEKGHFEFGGSTIILLLERDRVKLREDLLANTEAGYETQVRQGDALGISLRA